MLTVARQVDPLRIHSRLNRASRPLSYTSDLPARQAYDEGFQEISVDELHRPTNWCMI
jgi:hypothetical protein